MPAHSPQSDDMPQYAPSSTLQDFADELAAAINGEQTPFTIALDYGETALSDWKGLSRNRAWKHVQAEMQKRMEDALGKLRTARNMVEVARWQAAIDTLESIINMPADLMAQIELEEKHEQES